MLPKKKCSKSLNFWAILRFESLSFGVTKEKNSSSTFAFISGQTQF
jgi:hypothetical protein